jgi:hypothetical protein
MLPRYTMKYKTKKLVDRFAGLLSAWPGVECISLNEAAQEDTLAPYFALILDVFHSGPIPEEEERLICYGPGVELFETSARRDKDRFLVEGLPVRIEYKSTQRIDELVSIADSRLESLWLIKDSGTYGYYRLAQGELLFSRNQWISDIRRRLASLGDLVWNQIRDAHQSKMEHCLNDLGAALYQGDDFHYLISSALFIKYACLTLFCINRSFEPSHRGYYRQVLQLPVLPEAFASDLDYFLSTTPEMTPERKYALAQLIAKGIIAL